MHCNTAAQFQIGERELWLGFGSHPADVIHQEDEDVGLIAGLGVERGELVTRGLFPAPAGGDDRLHDLRRFHVRCT